MAAVDSGVPALEAGDVCVSYRKDRRALDCVSLSVRAGESFGLIGLNGAGKTTFIKSVLGLREVDSGTIRIFGQDRSDSQARSQLAYLPEKFEPPWFLKGGEFLEFSLALYGRKISVSEMEEAAARLNLDPSVLRNRVQTYSKGMRQKLGLLGTVLTGCPFLILDEPMSGLDPKARALVKRLLSECRAQGRTLFLSTHILADMRELCDRVAVMHGGKLIFTDSPEVLQGYSPQGSLEEAFVSLIDSEDQRRAA